jgi:CheY-like chemotaxis protein
MNEGKIKYNVLVVEDDETNIFFIKALLRKHSNINLKIAYNPKEALSIFNQYNLNGGLDLIIMDNKLQGIENAGYNLTSTLRNEHGYKGPIIAWTAGVKIGDKDKAFEAGCSDYLGKPLKNNNEFVQAIQKYLSHKN